MHPLLLECGERVRRLRHPGVHQRAAIQCAAVRPLPLAEVSRRDALRHVPRARRNVGGQVGLLASAERSLLRVDRRRHVRRQHQPQLLVPRRRAAGAERGRGRAPAPLGAWAAPPRLVSATPNPSRDGFAIRFSTRAPGPVSIAIFDAAGRRVRALYAGMLEAGAHETRWDGRDETGTESGIGIYFAWMREGEATRSVRLLRIR
ncbi:MAG: hypothetical protein E6K72_03875 [Candidatus Eisenbacteria bacterium]|uniref:FlgD/Vpr Ig-like domain-containing protein n=1 Tax=Eiseniibacteriota bacterium TaxID=2212470 RepID=A0A538T0R9_UNCEI|nr:MAG: hypothetical protein E6K72_03875 [Candidatus Eisenbacteria bacterium]